MIPYHYLQNSEYQLSELIQSLSHDEKVDGKDLLKQMGDEKIRSWFEDNYEEIIKYILSTPSQRNKKKKWNSDFAQKFLLIYFASFMVKLGLNFLKIMSENEIYLNESYREMTVKAYEIFSAIQMCDGVSFPLFDEDENF